ncbi:rhodoquinone biosynthesis methyltransferase RquA [Rhizomicrobium palustre]
MHPRAVQVFDRGWLINCILLGNYRRLVREALVEFDGPHFARILQIACVYGDLTPRIAQAAAEFMGSVDVVDVLAIQLRNLKWKLPARLPTKLMRMDSEALELAGEQYDSVLLFFLLHEQPEAVRQKTMKEALRVLKPGGKLIIVDYGKPYRWNPLRYLLAPFLALLEPFALSLMAEPLERRLPDGMAVTQHSYFGGLYQKVVARKPR